MVAAVEQQAAQVDRVAAVMAAAQMEMQVLRALPIEVEVVALAGIKQVRITLAKPVVQVLSSSRFLTPIPQPSPVV
jgi:hypothetical protein